MAYDNTEVSVSRSQEGIRKLILSRKGGKVAFISDPPREGFEAMIELDKLPYQIRIYGICKEAPQERGRVYRGSLKTTDKQRNEFREKEERRIWRVLFYHMKSLFESADSGVMELRELMLPYIVTKSGQTVAEHLLPNLAKNIEHNPARLLGN